MAFSSHHLYGIFSYSVILTSSKGLLAGLLAISFELLTGWYGLIQGTVQGAINVEIGSSGIKGACWTCELGKAATSTGTCTKPFEPSWK